jgi:hypothetical protein
MCPACMTTAALIVAGTTSAGGLTALVVRTLRAKAGARTINPATQTSGEQNGTPSGVTC